MEGSGRDLIKGPSRNLPGWTEKNHRIADLGLKFQTRACFIGSRNANQGLPHKSRSPNQGLFIRSRSANQGLLLLLYLQPLKLIGSTIVLDTLGAKKYSS
jgi:hypothetical protein